MHKHTYEAYKDKIKVENIITALFKDLKIRKQKVPQKIEQVCGSISFDNQGHSSCPRGENLLWQLYACDRLQYGIQHLEAWTSTDSRHQHHWKEEKNLHTKSYKAKLERLCLARLTRHDQVVRLLDMRRLQEVKTLVPTTISLNLFNQVLVILRYLTS
jgi:hypothetical protein